MRILIMGSGAVGGYYGAVLHRSGQDVTLVSRGPHLDAIRTGGLRIKSVTSGDFTVHPEAVQRPDEDPRPDLVLYCVKSYDDAEAIEALRPAVRRGTSILTLQNGIGSGDKLGAAFGSQKVLLGVTYVDAVRGDPGVVIEEGGPCNIVFGEEDGRRSPRAEAAYSVLKGAGIAVKLSDNVTGALWTKLVYISALSGMTCITRAPFSEVLDTPETLDLTRRVMLETAAVARARGVDLDDDLVDRTMDDFLASGGKMMSSMYNDLQRGNRIEVAVLNGAVARLGNEMGVAAPINKIIASCLAVAHNKALAARQANQPGG